MEINFKWKVTKKKKPTSTNTNRLSNMRPHKAFARKKEKMKIAEKKHCKTIKEMK